MWTGLINLDDNRCLGRLCDDPGDAMFTAPAYPGIERIEAHFSRGEVFAKHRHDTYALGVTLRGVQTFWYRGTRRVSLPGQVIVLHPDELHDGGAGTQEGLIYRMLYIDPALIGRALGEPGSLPFLSNAVLDDPSLRAALLTVLGDLDTEVDELAVDCLATELGQGLARQTLMPERHIAVAIDDLWRVKELLDAAITEPVGSGDLEAASGLDRFTLTRQFKAAFGTSPHRYLIMRRLGHGRHLLGSSQSIAEVALAAGFSDQSHFHRQFLKAYGLTPGHWRQLVSSRRRAVAS